MSDDATPRRRRRDSGMSLPEVLVGAMIMGLMTATLAMSTRAIVRQADNTEGRANNARSEQNVGVFMPADLASAEEVDTEPGSVPCGPSPACPPGTALGGSNAVMLSWSGQEFDVDSNSMRTTETHVSYRVVEVSGEFMLIRVECHGFEGDELACDTRTVLRDLEPPPPDVEWFAGTTKPSWLISVSAAGAADEVEGATTTTVASDPGYTNKNAQRVVVTINGGGDAAGAGGGRNQISLSAGGTNRQTNLSTDDLVGAPTFTASRSRCGGNFGVIIDKSGSIGSTDMTTVNNGVMAFIDTFAGTPVKLQVVTFSGRAATLGADDTTWTKYYDMLVESDVSALKALVGGITSNGGTNWEDGFFRMLRNSDGTVQSQLPNTILFFTDGIPTRSRLDDTSATAAATVHPDDNGFPASNGQDFSQIAWNRTERLLRDRGSINLVGVYVNSDTDADSSWMVRSGYHLDYERGNNVVFQQGGETYQRGNTIQWQVSTDSKLVFEKKVSGSWSTISRSTFLSGNTTPDETDNYRTRTTGTVSSSNSSWTTITEAQYHAANSSNAYSDGFRTRYSTTATSWITVTQAQYNLSNTTTTSSDGWRITSTWTNTTEALYNAGNTVTGEADGWRTTTSGSATAWTVVAKSVYDLSNSTGDSSDGWRSTKNYSEPYDFFDSTSGSTIKNYATIGNLVVGNTTGVESGFVEALPRGGPYTNAAAADLFVLPNYSNFGSALASVALGQCGGTVTLQTRVGSTAAQDPFVYENTTTNEIVQTSAAYRSGTFDIALPGGSSTTVRITPQQFTNLVRYQPAGWTCKSAGVNYPFTTVPVEGHSPWTAIELTVNPNQAVSCIQQVVLT